MDEIKIKRTRQVIKMPSFQKRVPIALWPVISEMIARYKKEIREQRQILKPKKKSKKELEIENQELKKKLQMQINLPCEKEKVEA